MSQAPKSRFYTLMIVPERASSMFKFTFPIWLGRLALGVLTCGLILLGVMLANYAFVLNQVSELSQMRMENRRLRQQVQVFRNKMDTLESGMERVRTLSTRLKIITGAEDPGGANALLKQIPDSSLTASLTPTIPAIEKIQQELDPKDPERINLQRDYERLEKEILKSTAEAIHLERTLEDQYEKLLDQRAFMNALPSRKPSKGYFTSGFGIRKSPLTGKVLMHEGLDIANHPGTAVHSTADGKVTWASTRAGYGQTIIIDHGYGLETWYAHLQKINVRTEQQIKRGQVIGQLGNSGRSTGPHLHYEVRVNGWPVDPRSYVLEE